METEFSKWYDELERALFNLGDHEKTEMIRDLVEKNVWGSAEWRLKISADSCLEVLDRRGVNAAMDAIEAIRNLKKYGN